MARKTEDDGSLKRLGGGRWQTRDERFTIEPESGTWVVVDAEQTDDLGLPLVRGPFGSLTAAKAAIEAARSSEPVVSPLAAQVEEHRKRPVAVAATPVRIEKPSPPAEPPWMLELTVEDRKRARILIERLAAAGAADPDGIARRELSGGESAVAAYAVGQAIEGLGPGATPGAVARVLASGGVPALGVSWRLVDGEGRPIEL